MGIFRGPVKEIIMREQVFNGQIHTDYGIYDTLLVSYSRYQEFKRILVQKPIDEREKLVASMAVDHNTVYYADSFGHVTKWLIKDEE